MDFRPTEEQEMLQDLAREILEAEVSHERLKALEAREQGFDPALHAKLAEANLLGLLLPEAMGGMGFGLVEVCVLLEEAGRALAPAALFESLLLGAWPMIELGSDAQRAEWLPALASGDAVLTAALQGPSGHPVDAPPTIAKREGEGWRLEGRLSLVRSFDVARAVLVPARTDEGLAVFVVPTDAEGLAATGHGMSQRQIRHSLVLDGVTLDDEARLGGSTVAREDLVRWADAAMIGICALQVGVSARAIEMTAAYAREREQFGTPIGTFQAVQHRMANAYMDLEAMRWTTLRAAWKLANRGEAHREARVAKFWAADAGPRIADSCQHLHGGHGVDLDYAIHRYFLWTKGLELEFGSATPQLVRLGAEMARAGIQEIRS